MLLMTVDAAVKPYITTSADYSTECKACPHSLCTNKLAYGGGDAFNTTCWTRGTKIMGDNLWLRSEAGCYVTQWDVQEYEGDYTKDLKYCGAHSEVEHITTEDATLQYKTECRICPEIDCDVAAYLPEETDVTLTCWTKEGQMVIDDPYWMKTTNNCYVAEIGLYSKPDITYLDNCGPIPFLEIERHFNENGTSQIDKRHPLPAPIGQSANYLINVTVGEDNAKCRSCPKESCKVEKRYPFNKEIWLQCLVENNGTWWSETTDFCYIKNSDIWQSPEGDYYRNPLCAYFDDPGSK
ncbi:uncharacterized protein BDR25DRAFT_328644 [Lindgomyces ingoldianus]|uniref:Uncharacterized protein n=1 Tax=Lindgomyces ingoldianus TaxID=673940 RepID=A0ACB6QHM0_9PLEO|nr:uncharacterized protein BDR25DRAFT_328644 [Lindgomyces ingoldianus]KAF2465635.1 hypothetical protein BDR25DRAFT_328644 [Lindgomyces ingoldianus]